MASAAATDTAGPTSFAICLHTLSKVARTAAKLAVSKEHELCRLCCAQEKAASPERSPFTPTDM